MTYTSPLLIAEESKRRERQLLKARFKAQNPKIGKDGKEIDRTIGMHVVTKRTTEQTDAQYKEANKQASAKYRATLKSVQKDKNGKSIFMTSGELRSRCLEITRSHA